MSRNTTELHEEPPVEGTPAGWRSGPRGSLPRRVVGILPSLALFVMLGAGAVRAEVSVVATVDRNRVALGESVAYTVAVQGAHRGVQPVLPQVDGLSFNGPSTQQQMSWVNGAVNQSVTFTYQVTPTRLGEITIPGAGVTIGDKVYRADPIKLTVEKGAVPEDLSRQLFLRAQLPTRQVYLGQVVPLDVLVYARADVPLRGFGGFNYEADGLGYKFLPSLKQGTQVIDGQTFTVAVISGVIAPVRTGTLSFGPCVIKGQLAVQKRGRRSGPFGDSMFDDVFGNVEVRELPLTLEAIPIEVLPLPAEGKPAEFAGAVGQWTLAVSAKPTEVGVGDPITLTVQIKGTGNIDTVPPLKLEGLGEFKTYDPTSKTTKNELGTTGERTVQQVLIPRREGAQSLAEVRLAYFDPVTRAYQTAVQPAIAVVVRKGSGAASTLISGGARWRPEEKLGQDIVYLKGELGPAAPALAVWRTPSFWALHGAPLLALAGGLGWQRRRDRLRGDVAYARRLRAAKTARALLRAATGHDQIQRALQSYLGDHLNIPVGGITGAVGEEHLGPRGVPASLVAEVQSCFEAGDSARFAGANVDAGVAALRERVERLIDELETTQL